jgi:glycosyltransferase involved in cell wall biosynthesis
MIKQGEKFMEPLISVIIPCFNTAEYLSQCMESLEKQTIGFEKMQFIFVDDASTDDGKTWNCIIQFEHLHPREVIAVHLDENQAQGGAKNVGISYAEAEYIGFIDSDDWIEPDMYQKLYECVEKYQCDAADCCIIKNFPDGREEIFTKQGDIYDYFEKSIIEGGTHWIKDFFHAGYGGYLVTGIYRKSIIDENNILFPEHLKYEDNYWSAILSVYLKTFYHLQDNCYHYRQRENSTVYLRNTSYHLDQMEIEELKIKTYKKLGIFERFEKEIESDFLHIYFCNTLIKLFAQCDHPSFEVYTKMVKRVKELFPDCLSNSYFKNEEFYSTLLKLVSKDINEIQFQEIGKMILQYCYASEQLKYNDAEKENQAIEQLLCTIKEYSLEEYFYKFGEIEKTLKKIENMLNGFTENQKKNIFQSMVNNIQEMSPWMRVHILSFCMKVSKDELYAIMLLDYILQAAYDDIGEYNKLSHFWQIGTAQFLDQSLQTYATNIRMAQLYMQLFHTFKESFGLKEQKYFSWQERNHDLVFVFSAQVLGMEHAPTKTLLDRCYVLKKYLKKEVVIIDTAMQMPMKGQAPFYGLANATYVEELSSLGQLEFNGEIFEFHQCENKMPDLEIIAGIIRMVKDRKPEFILDIGGSDLCADLCGLFVPQVTISTVFSKIAISCGEYQIINKVLSEDDIEELAVLGVDPLKVKQARFTFSFKKQTHHFTHKQLGLWEDKFILLVVGWRLDQEVDENFLDMLECVLKENQSIAVAFMGKFDLYNEKIKHYVRLQERSKNLGKQMDALAVTECCDLYVNPRRSGGGSSVSEALYKGLPAVTLPTGDVSVAAGELFWVEDYFAMQEKILKYASEQNYYKQMSEKAKKRAEELMDSNGGFGQTMETIIKEMGMSEEN